jgi:polyketide biosynthesis acyl carrier protein
MTENDILTLIVQHTREVLPELEGRPIAPSESLSDLGADSIDRAEIVNLVLESLAVDFPRAKLAGVRNIGELASALASRAEHV